MKDNFTLQVIKENLKIVIWGIILLAVLLFALISAIAYTPNYEPEEGIWYCEQLQIQLDYSGKGETFIKKDDVKIRCSCGSDRAVKMLQVFSQDLAFLFRLSHSCQFLR